MIRDFLKENDIPKPPHLDGWDELENMRILRFRGAVNGSTMPKILEFKDQLDKAGLPVKHAIFDGKNVTDIDSSVVAVLLIELKKRKQKIGLINPPEALKSYLDIFHERDKITIFNSEEEAIAAFNKKEPKAGYLPTIQRNLQKNKSLALLTALLMFIIGLPFFEQDMTAVLYLFFFATVLLTGIYAISYNMRHVAGGVLLAVPTLVTAWSNMFIQDPKILNAEMLFLAIFLIYTLSVTLIHILSVKKVTLNELFGAICVYIMIGMSFGVVYALLESLAPGSLSYPEGEVAPKLTAFYYFSFVSMSSTGFSGFAAVSSLARAIVIVQVIIGIMYVSALIGKLVSANTPDDDGLFDNMERKLKLDFWSREEAETFFRRRPFLLILSMAMLNYSSSVLMTVLNWPFFMDTWGTALAVVLGGLRAGIIVSIIYNLVMAFTFWEPSSWVWVFCSITIAFLTWFYLKRGWIDLRRPLELLGAGFIAGLVNSIAVMATTYFSQLPPYQGTMAVYHFFIKVTGSSTWASIAEKAAVEITDKTVSLFLVAVAVIFIRDILNFKRKEAGKIAS